MDDRNWLYVPVGLALIALLWSVVVLFFRILGS